LKFNTKASHTSTMKSIAIVASLLVASSANEQESTNLRRDLATSRKDGWLAAHNTRRAEYHDVPLSWSSGLRNEALKLAKAMSSNKCTISAPTNMVYGINLNARQGYPRVPTTEWVVKGWESKIDDEENNGMIVQALWKATEYVGCADSYNAVEKCSVSVCLYAKVCY
jgi:hypothetical protein